MSTPAGWVLSQVWYDQFRGMPPHGSPLELLFMLVVLQRQQAELLATRALVQTTLPEGQEAADPAVKAYQKYHDAMFPFLDRITDPDKEQQRERLERFVAHNARVDLRPIWRAKADNAKRIRNLNRKKLMQRKK